MTLRVVERHGPYYRVADRDWADPLDGDYAGRRGGRWNPPGSFPVVYLCREVAVARALVVRRLADLPYGPEDLDERTGPDLVVTDVPSFDYVDVVTASGCEAAGLPVSYPLHSDGRLVGHAECQPIGVRARDEGFPGIACRSAIEQSPDDGEELAWFEVRERLAVADRLSFVDWFWDERAA